MLSGVRPADYRPISVLSILEKITLKLWLREAQPYIDLKKPANHGFRGGWQAAELVHFIRSLSERREEWQLHSMLAKLDIQKAYDNVLWTAIQWVFELRGLPTWLQASYWRVHFGRVLLFRTCGDAIYLFLQPRCGMPQGAPENPAIQACIAEQIISLGESRLSVNGMPAEVPGSEPVIEQDAEAVESAKCEKPFPPLQCCVCKFRG